jgi:hypothetical protein
MTALMLDLTDCPGRVRRAQVDVNVNITESVAVRQEAATAIAPRHLREVADGHALAYKATHRNRYE